MVVVVGEKSGVISVLLLGMGRVVRGTGHLKISSWNFGNERKDSLGVKINSRNFGHEMVVI